MISNSNEDVKALLDAVEAEAGMPARVLLLAAITKHVPESDDPEVDVNYVLMKLALIKDAVSDEFTSFLRELFHYAVVQAVMGSDGDATEMSEEDAEDAAGDAEDAEDGGGAKVTSCTIILVALGVAATFTVLVSLGVTTLGYIHGLKV